MRYLVCHGTTHPDSMLDAILSVSRPFYVVTMDDLWRDVAAEARLPRLWFTDKLRLMQYVLGKDAICLLARDKTDETISMGASMYAMNVPVWHVMEMEEA